MSQRVICQSCDWIGPASELLVATNPFGQHSEIYGCPKCYAIDDHVLACDEPGCDREATCGWNSDSGYRQTCFTHSDWAQQRQQAQEGGK